MLQLSAQTFGYKEVEAAKAVLESGRVTMGSQTTLFEEEFATAQGAKHAIMVNSGSSANLLIVAAAVHEGLLEAGNKVFVPALTWPTTVWPLWRYGMNLVFLDCDEHLQISPATLEEACEAHPDAVGLFLAHIMGNAAQMEKIEELCYKYGLSLFEDCCESLGAESSSRRVGSYGLAASFSFYFSHHITTVEGGMVTTDNDDFADYARSIRSHGWTRTFNSARRHLIEANNRSIDPRFLFVMEGYNLRPTEIQAAMGREQLKRLDDFARSREHIDASMRKIVKRYPQLSPIEPSPEARPSWFAFPMLYTDDRNALVAHLAKCSIDTRPIVGGNLTRHPAFADMAAERRFPVADKVSQRGFYWGLHPMVTMRQLRHLEDSLATFDWKGR